MADFFWSIDIPILLTLLLVGFSCAPLGFFLVIQRKAMMGDAMSHAVLPGLVLGFLWSQFNFQPFVLFLSACASCLLAFALIHFIEKRTRFDRGSIIGLVFTSFFALGVLLLETKIGEQTHFDIQHVLFGSLDMMYWPELSPPSLSSFLNIPTIIIALLLSSLASLCFVFFAGQRFLSYAFDRDFYSTQHFVSSRLNLIFIILCVSALTASFQAVGSILTLGFLVLPAALAIMLSGSLWAQMTWMAVFLFLSSVLGYAVATHIGLLWGRSDFDVNIGGMNIVILGLSFILVLILQKRRRRTE
jgi:manganese/zinc/iron transport system permease protein